MSKKKSAEKNLELLLMGDVGSIPGNEGQIESGIAAEEVGDEFGDAVDHGDMSAADELQPTPESSMQIVNPLGVLLPEVARAAESAETFGSEPGGRLSAAEVFGRDDRGRVRDTSTYPFRAICQLLITKGHKQQVGTAWFGGNNLLVTAGHNLFDNRELGSGWVDRIEIFPGLNREQELMPAISIHKSSAPERLRVSRGWGQRQSDRDTLDYGAIILREPLGKRLGFFGLKVSSRSDLLRTQLNVVGYPGSPVPFGTQLGAKGIPIDVRDRTLRYRVDTSGGQSGCPVFFVPEGRRPDEGVFVVGIHVQAFASENAAIRITPSVSNQVKAWRELSSQQ